MMLDRRISLDKSIGMLVGFFLHVASVCFLLVPISTLNLSITRKLMSTTRSSGKSVVDVIAFKKRKISSEKKTRRNRKNFFFRLSRFTAPSMRLNGVLMLAALKFNSRNYSI